MKKWYLVFNSLGWFGLLIKSEKSYIILRSIDINNGKSH